MSKTRNDLMTQLAEQAIKHEDLYKIKGGIMSQAQKDWEEEQEKLLKLCEKAWKQAEKLAKKEARILRRNGNGDGIW